MRYPEGVVENFLVKVRNNFILADFVVLDMEGDLEIQLILGWPFLRDANTRIDIGSGKVSLRIMGKTMKFKFQNKRELFLIHEDSEKQGLWAEPGWENWNIHHSPSEPAWEDWEIHDPPAEPAEDDCWYFLTLTEKSASARKYHCSTSPGSIQGILFSTRNGCVTVF